MSDDNVIGLDWGVPTETHPTYILAIQQANGGFQSIVLSESGSMEGAKREAIERLKQLCEEIERSDP